MFLDINGCRVNTVSFGAGTRTLVAHGGWVGSWEVWQQPFELMSGTWRCVSYDHRGAGATVARPETITPEALVADLLAVLDALGIKRCVLAGESLGCVVALSAVLSQPHRFDGLVLVDGSGAVTDALRPLIDGSRTDFPETVRWFVDACVPEPDSEHLRRWGRQILLRADPEAAARILDCYLERDQARLPIERIAIPTLVVHGTADAIVPLAAGRAMAQAIPGATFLPLEGAGHVPTVTRPAEIAAAIQARFAGGSELQAIVQGL